MVLVLGHQSRLLLLLKADDQVTALVVVCWRARDNLHLGLVHFGYHVLQDLVEELRFVGHHPSILDEAGWNLISLGVVTHVELLVETSLALFSVVPGLSRLLQVLLVM